jgi:hypothetical protein
MNKTYFTIAVLKKALEISLRHPFLQIIVGGTFEKLRRPWSKCMSKCGPRLAKENLAGCLGVYIAATSYLLALLDPPSPILLLSTGQVTNSCCHSTNLPKASRLSLSLSCRHSLLTCCDPSIANVQHTLLWFEKARLMHELFCARLRFLQGSFIAIASKLSSYF